mgnify:CR=1 FL=1
MNNHLEEVEKEFAPLHEPTLEMFENNQKPKYIITLGLYLGYMILPFLLSIFIVIFLMNNKAVFIQADPTMNAMELALEDVNSFLIVKRDRFELDDPIYEKFFYNVYVTGEYSVYTHKSATFYPLEPIFQLNNSNPNVIDYNITLEGLNAILQGEKTTWNNHAEISFYIPIDDVAPFVQGSAIDILDNKIADGIIPTTAFNSIFSFVLYVIVMVPMVLLLQPVLKNDFMFVKQNSKSDTLSKVGIGVLYIFGANIAINIVVKIFNSLFNVPEQISANQLAINRALASPYFILMAFMAVIMAPVVEELVFRKAFFGVIKKQTTALIISSLIFGSIHITTELISGDFLLAFTNGLTYIGGGVVLGLIYMQNNKNIWINIFVHMAYNLIGILITLYIP